MSLFGDYWGALEAHTEEVLSGKVKKQKKAKKQLTAWDYVSGLFRIVAAYVLGCCTFIVWWSWLQKEMSLPAWKSSLDGLAFNSKKIWNNPGGKGRGAVHPSTLAWSFSFWLTTLVVIDSKVMPYDTLPLLCAVLGGPLRMNYYLAPSVALLGGTLLANEYGKEFALEGNDSAEGNMGASDGIRDSVHRVVVDHDV
jgi:hypothetical protein